MGLKGSMMVTSGQIIDMSRSKKKRKTQRKMKKNFSKMINQGNHSSDNDDEHRKISFTTDSDNTDIAASSHMPLNKKKTKSEFESEN